MENASRYFFQGKGRKKGAEGMKVEFSRFYIFIRRRRGIMINAP